MNQQTTPQHTPEAGGQHYGKIQPLHLTRVMESSGNAHADFCRGNIIKYGFRKKGDLPKMIDDLRKAEHYAREAAETLERVLAEQTQPELDFDAAPKCPHCGGRSGQRHNACPTNADGLIHTNGHRCRLLPPGPNEGLAVCVDCGKAEAELDTPCPATNGGA